MVLSELDTPVEAGRLPMNMEQLRLELSSSTRIEEFQLGDEVVPSEPPLDQGPPPARVDMSPMVQDGQIRNDMGQDRDGASGMGRRSARILRVKSTGGCRSAPGDQSYVWMLTIGLLVLLRRCSPKGE